MLHIIEDKNKNKKNQALLTSAYSWCAWVLFIYVYMYFSCLHQWILNEVLFVLFIYVYMYFSYLHQWILNEVLVVLGLRGKMSPDECECYKLISSDNNKGPCVVSLFYPFALLLSLPHFQFLSLSLYFSCLSPPLFLSSFFLPCSTLSSVYLSFALYPPPLSPTHNPVFFIIHESYYIWLCSNSLGALS